jgi:hypothetical protein
MAEKFNMADFLQFYKKKINVAKLKIQNGGLIQNGDKIILIGHRISRHFDFFARQHLFYFILALELQSIKK